MPKRSLESDHIAAVLADKNPGGRDHAVHVRLVPDTVWQTAVAGAEDLGAAGPRYQREGDIGRLLAVATYVPKSTVSIRSTEEVRPIHS